MLNFVSPRLALSYLLLCTFSCIGVLQLQAARQRLDGLSLWGGQGARWWGYIVGLSLIFGSFAAFYTLAPNLFVPGLAGSELVILFTAGFALALVITLAAASLAAPRPTEAAMEANEGKAVAAPQLGGWVYAPQGSGPFPALCLVPEIGSPAADLGIVAAQLRDMGFVTLSIDWTAEGDFPRYPDVLALVPSGVRYLLQRPEVDRRRIGVVGFGLGGDLTLRAVGADEQIAVAVAVDPYLSSEPCDPGLDLLRQRSLWQAVRWKRKHKAQSSMAKQLNGLAFLSQILPRPLLILHSPQHSLSGLPNEVETRSLPDDHREGLPWRQNVARVIGRWCEEHL
ncbi:MAG: hypothetical protein U9Q78_08655 [Chloroflexota bacterium]|nr:hypothetical protein [Chloroflexota bacterium]